MILRVVFSLFLLSLVSSGLELCGDPKIDSIAYNPEKNFWFFTSQGYYWYIDEVDFPPKEATGKLPEGFSRGDGAIYMDYLKVCDGVPKAKLDQVIVLVELVGNENKYIEFDTKTNKWSSSNSWSAIPLSNGNLEVNGQIEGMFSMGGGVAYIFQKGKYVAVDWKNTCDPRNKFPKKSQFSYNSNQDLNNGRDTIDAITVKGGIGGNLYYFVGSDYWSARVGVKKVDYQLQLLGGKTPEQKTRLFFNLKDCPTIVNKTVVSNVSTTTIEPQKALDSTPRTESSNENESKSVSVALILVLVFVVIFVLAFIVGVVYLAIRKKSGTTDSKIETQPKSMAKQSKAIPTKKAKKPKK